MRIRALERSDVRQGFDCGEPSLNVFLARYAGQNQFRRRLGVTYVAVDEATRVVVGYVTLVGAALRRERLQEEVGRAPYADVPVVRIARLAVDRRVQGAGLGSELIGTAIEIAREQAARVGCVGLVVDALQDSVGFYERLGFKRMALVGGRSAARPRPVNMFLALRHVE